MDVNSIWESLGVGAAGSVGVIASVWKLFEGRVRAIAKEESESRQISISPITSSELCAFEKKLEKYQERLDAGANRMEKLEKEDSQVRIDLLTTIKGLSDETAKWRDDIRKDILSREALDGIILRAIHEHNAACQTTHSTAYLRRQK